MSYQDQIGRFHTLDEWFASPLGQSVAQAFTTELSYLKKLLFGGILLQLGNCAANEWFEHLRFQHKWLVSPMVDTNKITFCANFMHMPLDRDCVDCIVAPLTLDAFTSKKNPLDEIDRILKPMGYVVFIGINPLSLWGAWLRYSKNSCFGALKGRPKSALMIKRAMLHRGYIQCHFNAFYYTPPLRNERIRQKFSLLNQVSKMVSLNPAGFYCLVMQKYVEDYLPLAPKNQENQLLEPSSGLRPICRDNF